MTIKWLHLHYFHGNCCFQ